SVYSLACVFVMELLFVIWSVLEFPTSGVFGLHTFGCVNEEGEADGEGEGEAEAEGEGREGRKVAIVGFTQRLLNMNGEVDEHTNYAILGMLMCDASFCVQYQCAHGLPFYLYLLMVCTTLSTLINI